jgi:DNA-binding beta-propeller fold protein YncE
MRIAASLLCAVVVASCATSGSEAPPSEAEMAGQGLVFPPPPEQARFFFERTITSTADVAMEDSEGKWRRVLTGEKQRSVAFSKPFDVEACQGRIYVSDTVKRAVILLDVQTGGFKEIGTEEPGELLKPLGMAVDEECNLYVVDGTARRIVVFDADGDFVSAFGGSSFFDRPSHVEVDPEGRRAYVVDTGGVGSESHKVKMFDIETGEHIGDIGERGSGPGQFNLARDIAMGRDNQLYVVDGGNFRVQVFTADGAFVRTFGSIGVMMGQFSRPKGVDTDPAGNVYVTDSAFGNFQIFDPEGRLLLFVGSRSSSPGPAKYMLPAGIAIDEDGRIYMVDQFFRKVDIYRPAALRADEGFLGRLANAR